MSHEEAVSQWEQWASLEGKPWPPGFFLQRVGGPNGVLHIRVNTEIKMNLHHITERENKVDATVQPVKNATQ